MGATNTNSQNLFTVLHKTTDVFLTMLTFLDNLDKVLNTFCNVSFSWPDQLINKPVIPSNLHFNRQTFAACLVHYMKWIDRNCQKSLLNCVISDIKHAVHPKISHQIYILTVFWVNSEGTYIETHIITENRY